MFIGSKNVGRLTNMFRIFKKCPQKLFFCYFVILKCIVELENVHYFRYMFVNSKTVLEFNKRLRI